MNIATTNKIEKKYTWQEGCDNARSDAKHDFHTIREINKDVQKYVSKNIPLDMNHNCEDKDVLDEDDFLIKYLLNGNKISQMHKLFNTPSNSDTPINMADIFNENIIKRYNIINVVRAQHDNSIKKSLIQESLNKIGVLNDVYIICDVAYANIREDLTYVDKNSPQTFYWVQNSQTLYDPAGKTAWHTGAEYGFKDDDSKFLFCWENLNKKAITYYPQWVNETEIDCNDDNVNNKVIYTNKDLYLLTKGCKDNLNDYNNHEAILIITDTSKPGYYAFADKHYSAKGSGILNKSEMLSYREKGNSLKQFVRLLQSSYDNDNNISLREIEDYSASTQILAKKIGDSAQSQVTLKPLFELQKFSTPSQGYKGGIVDFVSNGCHAFVSFDRIAVATATNYNAPIVIQNSQDGMIIYVRKDLVSLDIQLTNVTKSFNDSDKFTDFDVLVANINKFISNFNNIKTVLGTFETIDTDEKYKLLLSKYFLLVPIFLLIKGVNQNIINNFNNVNVEYIKNIFLKNYIVIDNPEDFISKQNEILAKLKTTGDENEKKANRNTGFNIQSDFSKLKNYYNELKNSNILFTKINSFFTSDIVKNIENQNITLDELYKIIPKKIVDHIKCCEPFKHAINTMSEPRNHNAFIERSTQYFGTNTVIIPIFESLSNSIENNIETNFVEKIKDTITSIKTIANSNKNISFLRLLEITNKELEKLHNYKPPLKYVNDEKDNELKTQILEKNEELKKLKGELDELNGSIEKENDNLNSKDRNKTKKANDEIYKINIKIKKLNEDNIEPTIEKMKIIKRKRNDYESFFIKHNLLFPKDKIITTPNFINILITKLKNVILIKEYLNEIISSFNNIGTPSNIIPSTQTNNVTNNVIEDNPDKANEIEIFLKGFLGCMIFLKYNEKKGLSVPTILKKKTGGQTEYQDTIITEFIKIAYNLLFNSDDYDSLNNDELYPQDNIKYKGLNGIIVRKKIDKNYDIRTSDNKRHNNINRSDIKKIFLDKKDDIIIFSQDDINQFSEEEKKNITKDYSKNEYDENAFKKLIDMNSISFDEKPLSGEYEGFNANQFNFNKTLLLYLEYRINTLNNISENNKSRPPELYGMNELFKQLFEGTGITITGGGNPKEAVLTLNPMISEIFNSFFDDNNVVKYDKIQTFKQNLNFMLNMPTVNEIITVIQLENDVEETKLINYSDNKGSDYYKDFRDLFDRAHPDMIRKINSVYNSIVQEKQVTIFKPVSMSTGTNLSNKDLNIPEQKPSVFSFGGKKTRRYNKKISRNYRIKKNKTNRRRNNKKTRKS